MGRILDKVTLDLSKGRFFLYKLGMFSLIISHLKSKKYLKSMLEMT